jgi:hypothetical protein
LNFSTAWLKKVYNIQNVTYEDPSISHSNYFGGVGKGGQKCGNMGNGVYMFECMWHVLMLPSDQGIHTRGHTYFMCKHLLTHACSGHSMSFHTDMLVAITEHNIDEDNGL